MLHYKNVESLLIKQQWYDKHLPSALKGIDVNKMQLIYEKMLSNDKTMEEIAGILLYAAPRFKSFVEAGREIFQLVEQMVSIESVGLLPLNKDYGYLIIYTESNKEKKVFEYHLSAIEDPGENHRIMSVNYCRTFAHSFTDTFPSIKCELIRQNKSMPNPAVYSAICKHDFPFYETLLPVVRRVFLKTLAS
jgi:hypothetical protein